MAYTKLFNSIITSTIWSEDDKTRIVWITMMALADKNGEVMGSIPGLARVAGVPVDDCRLAISKFLSPDPDSRTTDDEGRRIEIIDGGWHLINHQKYREMATDAERAEKAAIRQSRKRAKDKEKVTQSHARITPESHQNPQAEAEAEAEAESRKQKKENIPPNPQGGIAPEKPQGKGTLEQLKSYAVEIGLPESDGEAMFDHWESNGWRNGQSPSKNWRAGIRKWKSQGWLPSQKIAATSKPAHRQGGYQEDLELP